MQFKYLLKEKVILLSLLSSKCERGSLRNSKTFVVISSEQFKLILELKIFPQKSVGKGGCRGGYKIFIYNIAPLRFKEFIGIAY